MDNLENRVKWGDIKHLGIDPLEFYNQHYSGLKGIELQKVDSSLYNVIRGRNLHNQIPGFFKIRKKKIKVKKRHHRFKGDPLEYYQKHYTGLTRCELDKKDHSLYVSLGREKLLDKIPLHRIDWNNIKWKDVSDLGIPPVIFYEVNYPGLIRKQLHDVDSPLYRYLGKLGLIDKITSRI